MAVIDVYNLQREKASQMDLREDIFGIPVNKHVLHQVVVSQLADRRSGTAGRKDPLRSQPLRTKALQTERDGKCEGG